jgi:hypothetical protein
MSRRKILEAALEGTVRERSDGTRSGLVFIFAGSSGWIGRSTTALQNWQRTVISPGPNSSVAPQVGQAAFLAEEELAMGGSFAGGRPA